MATEPPITSAYEPDVDRVRAWLKEMIAAMRFVELVVAIVALIARIRAVNAELMKQVAQMRRKRPRSESLERLQRQLVLPLDILATKVPAKEPADAEDEDAEDKKEKKSRVGRHPGRAAFPAHLPRVDVYNLVPADERVCPQCGREMTTVSHSTCETLTVIPARIVVERRHDETVACPADDTIVSASAPARIVEKGKLADTFIVEALCDKYLEHQPVERQCTRFARSGVEVAPQTLGCNVGAAIDLLRPVADLIADKTREPGLLGTDATGIPVLDPNALEGIRTGTVWAWTNARWVTFFYSPSGDAASVRAFLGDDNLARTVQCDGTSVLNVVEKSGGRRPGCMAHGRRRLVEAARLGDALALDGLKIIARLFVVERAATLAGDTAAERLARRTEHSQPVIDELRAFLEEHRAVTPPKTPLGRALGYLHRQWRRLTLFLEDGNIELTNNRRERELRRLVLGRRNWLFTWLDEGGERTAAILTLIATCIAHDVNPRAYLHLVTRLIVRGWPHAGLRDLLPDRLLASHPDLYIGDPESPPPALGV